MKLADYIPLIEQMPIENHSFTIKKINWKNDSQQNSIDNIFDNNQVITINRYDLISGYQHDLDTFVIKTLMWGYPEKGRGNNIDNLLEKETYNTLLEILQNYKSLDIDGEVLQEDIKKVGGLGLSTMSKFLCFMKVKVDKQLALILDRRIIDVVKSGIFEELQSLKSINYPTTIKRYVEYLKVINSFADTHHILSEKVEMFIFMFGKHLSPLKGEECYDDIFDI